LLCKIWIQEQLSRKWNCPFTAAPSTINTFKSRHDTILCGADQISGRNSDTSR
jgi:hypothetical protein